jgi:hypothetical protein
MSGWQHTLNVAAAVNNGTYRKQMMYKLFEILIYLGKKESIVEMKR